MERGAKEESEKKIRRKRGRGGKEVFRFHSYPSPSLFFFPAHISLRGPHDLNAWNKLRLSSIFDYLYSLY